MAQQIHTAELRAKIKKLLAPEGLSRSKLRVDACGEGNSLCPAGAREPPRVRPAPYWIFELRSPSPSCMTLAHVKPQPCNEITLITQ